MSFPDSRNHFLARKALGAARLACMPAWCLPSSISAGCAAARSAHLMRCDDGGYYVVKFQNNPQHLRILANEMLGTRLAARLGLPVPRTEVVEVRRELIELTADLVMQLGMGSDAVPRRASSSARAIRAIRRAWRCTIFCPTSNCARWRISRISRACWSYDKWTCNTNGRQAIFFIEPGRSRYQAHDDRPGLLLQRRRVEFSRCAAAGHLSAPSRLRARHGHRFVRALAERASSSA